MENSQREINKADEIIINKNHEARHSLEISTQL